MSADLLLIEDDIELQTYISEYLKEYNFNTLIASNPIDAIKILTDENSIQVIILDLTLPQMDGFELFQKIKKIKDIPVIISSARCDIDNKIHGFEIGADDYLTKPYEPRELVLRINYILKHRDSNPLHVGPFEINMENRSVLFEDYPIEFTKIEFDIFIFLIENLNKICSREQLIEIAGLNPRTKNRTIDTHILNIRTKFEDNSKDPNYIKSVWGIGYKMVI